MSTELQVPFVVKSVVSILSVGGGDNGRQREGRGTTGHLESLGEGISGGNGREGEDRGASGVAVRKSTCANGGQAVVCPQAAA